DSLGAAEAAREALDVGQRAVELERLDGSGGAMKAVDILRQHPPDEPAPLELGDREMTVVRSCRRELRQAPAVEIPELRRLASPHVDVGQLLEAAVAPQALAPSVVGEAALGRDARAGGV